MNKLALVLLSVLVIAVYCVESKMSHTTRTTTTTTTTSTSTTTTSRSKDRDREMERNYRKNVEKLVKVMKDRHKKAAKLYKTIMYEYSKFYSFAGTRVCTGNGTTKVFRDEYSPNDYTDNKKQQKTTTATTTTTTTTTTTSKDVMAIFATTSFYHVMGTNHLTYYNQDELRGLLGLRFLSAPQSVMVNLNNEQGTTTTAQTTKAAKRKTIEIHVEDDHENCTYFAYQIGHAIDYDEDWEYHLGLKTTTKSKNAGSVSLTSSTTSTTTTTTTTTKPTTSTTTTTTTTTKPTTTTSKSASTATTTKSTSTTTTTTKPTTTTTTTTTTKPTTTISAATAAAAASSSSTVNVPSTLDWSSTQYVTEVKDQGVCGSCWAFAALAGLESAVALSLKMPAKSMSVQNVLDCTYFNDTFWKEHAPDFLAWGCSGGSSLSALAYVGYNGIDSESNYPYTAGSIGSGYTQNCKGEKNPADPIDQVIELFDRNGTNNYMNMMAAVTKGPITAFLEVPLNDNNDGYDFFAYKSGIYVTPYCATVTLNASTTNDQLDTAFGRLNHAVLIVGYGRENNKDYWLCKNSWGKSWGMDGYFKILRGVNHCSIEIYATYTTISNSFKMPNNY